MGILSRIDKDKNPQAVINIGVLGNSNVGKTSLTNKFRSADFVLGPKVTTYGTDVFKVYLSINESVNIRVNIWDTAGQEKGAKAFVTA